MAGDRLRRFMHLERRRPAPGAADDGATADAARFEALERPAAGPGPEPAGTGARLERFGAEPEPRIELADPEQGAPRFAPCLRCGTENGAFATRCAGCDADLDTPEQRASDEERWARRQAEARQEEAATVERRAALDRDAAEEAAARRALGETLAREVGRMERLRISREERAAGWGGGWGAGGDAAPVGLRLLRLVESPARRVAIAAAAIGLPAALLLVPIPAVRAAGAVGLLLVAVLALPFPDGRW
jgi:hypothetical protein